jgi:hypothetical protein
MKMSRRDAKRGFVHQDPRFSRSLGAIGIQTGWSMQTCNSTAEISLNTQLPYHCVCLQR